MQVIALRTLKLFWARHSDAERPLRHWYGLVSRANWDNPNEVKNDFGARIDFVGDNRVIFDIAGNKYRLIAHISCKYRRVLIKFIGTHGDYDQVNAEPIT
jgi:mRNA interferase HigB